jgi:hypothetical protein
MINFQKKIERDVYFKTIFVIALSVFCLYLLKIWTMVAYIESFRATECLWYERIMLNERFIKICRPVS